MERVLILDVSKWQNPDSIDYDVLWSLGFRMVIIKASMGGGADSLATAHATRARAHGFLVGLYHWCDPTQNWEAQAGFFIEKIDELNPEVIAYDIEQWWSDWNLWNKYVAGDIPNSSVPRLTANQVINNYLTIRNIVLAHTAGTIPERRHLAYTGMWFVNMFPGLQEAIADHALWMADYSLSRTIVNSWFNGDSTFDQAQWDSWYDELCSENPVLPEILGDDDYLVWQVDSIVQAPGTSDNWDMSLFKGGEAEFYAWVEQDVPTPEPPPIDPDWPGDALMKVEVVTPYGLNVRKGPNINNPKVGSVMPQGTQKYVYEVHGKWGRIESNKCHWCHLGYTRDVD